MALKWLRKISTIIFLPLEYANLMIYHTLMIYIVQNGINSIPFISNCLFLAPNSSHEVLPVTKKIENITSYRFAALPMSEFNKLAHFIGYLLIR